MKSKPDWFRIIAILGLGAALVWFLIAIGKSPVGLVLGAETEVTWTAPTQRCDGTALTNLAGYSLTYGQSRVDLPTTPMAYTVTGLKPGLWWFSLAAVDADGNRSEFVTVTRDVQPEEFVTKTTKVYTFFRANGNIVVTVTPHTVALGVVCDASQSVNGKYRVALENITWAGTPLTAALADCG